MRNVRSRIGSLGSIARVGLAATVPALARCGADNSAPDSQADAPAADAELETADSGDAEEDGDATADFRSEEEVADEPDTSEDPTDDDGDAYPACNPAGRPGERVIAEHGDDGRLTLADSSGRAIAAGVRAELFVEVGGVRQVLRSDVDCDAAWGPISAPSEWRAPFADWSGQSRACTQGAATWRWEFFSGPNGTDFITRVVVERAGSGDLRLLRASPFVAEGGDSGAFVGDHVANTRIVDNGRDLAFDVESLIHYPDEPRSLFANMLPIQPRGSVISNNSQAIIELDDGAGWVAGILDTEMTLTTFGTVYTGGREALDTTCAMDGTPRSGFTGYWVDSIYAFRGKSVPPGESIASEPIWLRPAAPDGAEALEAYATAVAAFQGVVPWTRRGGGRRVPNGWNSWTGSGSTGGLGTSIDATIIRENLAVMEREFAPYGVDWFQVDDGWQIDDGDWEARADRFPEGMEALAMEIASAGLTPGLWISPFRVSLASSIAREHGDWLLREEDNALMNVITAGPGYGMLDLSNEEALDWLDETMERVAGTWGNRWVKQDFGYYAVTYHPRANPELTSVESYRGALERERGVLGDDVFFLGIGLVGLNLGVADGMRLTLDNGPRWDEGDPFALFGEGGSFKATIKTAARRWYLHDRVWLSHDDLLFFRTEPGTSPPVTMQESITLASFFALTGSIVKFGEDLRTLTPEQINVWRRILPVYGPSARPLDFATMLYPETYVLHVSPPSDEPHPGWTLLGLLNLGRNYDYSGPSRRLVPDARRSWEIEASGLGLDSDATYVAWDSWREESLGTVSGTLRFTVEPHESALIVLRRDEGVPMFLADNRHVTAGGTTLRGEAWDASLRELTVRLAGDAPSAEAVPFGRRVWLHVPEGWVLDRAWGAGPGTVVAGEIAHADVLPLEAPGEVVLRWRFVTSD